MIARESADGTGRMVEQVKQELTSKFIDKLIIYHSVTDVRYHTKLFVFPDRPTVEGFRLKGVDPDNKMTRDLSSHCLSL